MYCFHPLFCNVGFCQSVSEMCCAGGAFIFMTPNRKKSVYSNLWAKH